MKRAVGRLTDFYGWRVLASMMTVRGVGGGINMYGTSLFVLPIQTDLGLSRGAISTVLTAGLIVRNLTAPIGGRLIDRFGARRMLFFSLVLSGVGYIALAAAANVLMLALIFVGMVSLGFHVLLFQAPSVIINHWFDRRKGLAMSLLQVGAGVGGALLMPLLGFVIITFGWRPASVLAGLALLVICLPMVLVVRDTPEEMGETPDGVPQTSAAAAGVGEGATLRQAIHTPHYWLIAFTMLSLSGASGAVAFHFVPIVIGKGWSDATAYGLWSTLALLSIPVIVLTGWLADRVDRLKVSVVLLVVLAAGVVVLNLADSLAVLGLATLLMAGTQGIYPLLWAATGDVFGRRAFGSIRGSIEGLLVLGMAMPPIFGFMHDWQDDYRIALWGAAALCLVSAGLALVTSVQAPPQFAESAPEPVPAT